MQREGRPPIAELARGRWKGMLPRLGVPPSALTGKHGPCPVCGGKDRFRFDNKDGKGTWICSQCGAGDGFRLAQLVKGVEFVDVARIVEGLVGSVQPEPIRPGQTAAEQHQRLNETWQSGRPISAGDAVGRWLKRRVGKVVESPALRYVRRLRHQGDVVTFHPAMIAMVSDRAGEPVTIHRTYLTDEGLKANVAMPRKLMPFPLPKGVSVRLSEPAGGVLGIAEGIETALAVTELFGRPCWAATNATMLGQWAPPAGVTHVIVYGDNDRKFGGQAAAFALAHRLACDERLSVTAEVSLPPKEGEDWNDVLMRQMGEQHAA
jgi:putative DNA primase/helicase